MAYAAYARFLDPADEPSFEGVTAENIEIEEVEIAGRFLPIQLLADFEWEDAAGWRVERCFLKVLARQTIKNEMGLTVRYVETEDYVPIHDKPEWAAIVTATKAWADAGLDVSEFA